MLTGRRAFDGEDPVEVLGAVVRLEPDWRALPPDVPIPLRTFMEGCLVKDRRRRIGDISTARFVLDHMPRSAAVRRYRAVRRSRPAVSGGGACRRAAHECRRGGGRLVVAASAAPDRRQVLVLADRDRGYQRGPGQPRPGNPSRRPTLRVHRAWCSGQRTTTLCPAVGSTRAEAPSSPSVCRVRRSHRRTARPSALSPWKVGRCSRRWRSPAEPRLRCANWTARAAARRGVRMAR